MEKPLKMEAHSQASAHCSEDTNNSDQNNEMQLIKIQMNLIMNNRICHQFGYPGAEEYKIIKYVQQKCDIAKLTLEMELGNERPVPINPEIDGNRPNKRPRPNSEQRVPDSRRTTRQAEHSSEDESSDILIFNGIRPIETQLRVLTEAVKKLVSSPNLTSANIMRDIEKGSRIIAVAYALALANDVPPIRKYQIALQHGMLLCRRGLSHTALSVYKHTAFVLGENPRLNLRKLWMHKAIALAACGNMVEAHNLIYEHV